MTYYGIKSGMTYLEYLCFLFDLNSSLKKKLSDEQLILKILKEFPHKKELIKTLTAKQLATYRARYNSGCLSCKYPAPQIPSFRYIKGAIVSKYGKPLTPFNLKLRLKNQIRRWKRYNARSIKKEIAKKVRIKKVKKVTSKFQTDVRRRRSLKVFSKRYKLQKKLAKLQGVSPWPNA